MNKRGVSIYLSKSNSANPDHVMIVRKHLVDLGFNVIEHQGGEYKESNLLNAKYMVMVGYDQVFEPVINNLATTTVGKGQYGQLRYREGNLNNNNFYTYFRKSEPKDDNEMRFSFWEVKKDALINAYNYSVDHGKVRVNFGKKKIFQPLQEKTQTNKRTAGKIIIKRHLACINHV